MLTSSLIVLVGCLSDKTPQTTNPAPQITITAPSEGESVVEGYPFTARSQVADSNDEYQTLEVKWLYAEQTACDWSSPDPSGVHECNILITQPHQRIEAVVRDPSGAESNHSVAIVLVDSEAPTAEIFSPRPDGTYYSDHRVFFEGIVNDSEEAADALLVTWTSSLEEELLLTNTATTSGMIQGEHFLREGEHQILLTAQDSTGKTGTDTVSVVVGPANVLPSCAITSPTTAITSSMGTPIDVQGTATDPNIPNESLTVLWRSSHDGDLITSTPLADGTVSATLDHLSQNEHTITMVVQDEVYGTCTASQTVIVGHPPQVEITAPLDGFVYDEGEAVTFSAQLTDLDEAVTFLDVSWELNATPFSIQSADQQGVAQFSVSSVPVGTHSLTITAVDHLGLSATDHVSFVVNAPPSLPSIEISPYPAYTTDDVTATVFNSIDPEGASVSFQYEWLVDGVLTTVTGPVLPHSLTTKAQEWSLRVTPSDGLTNGPTAVTQVVIANTPPTISDISISPDVGVVTGSLLSCLISASDIDGGSPSLQHLWTNDSTGQTLGNVSVLQLQPTMSTPNDVIRCTGTATDTEGTQTSASAAVTVGNSLPIASDLALNPSEIYTDDDIQASVLINDADISQTISATFDWHVIRQGTDTIVQSGSEQTLSGLTHFDKGDEVYAVVTPFDGLEYGSSITSSTTTIQNSLPTTPTISLSPQDAEAGIDPLVCTIESSSVDADQDPLIYTYVWRDDGVLRQTTTTTALQDVFSGATTSDGSWTCVVTSNDGSDDGVPASASATVEASCSGLDFDGQSQYVEIASHSLLPAANTPRSMAMWFFPTTDHTGNLWSFGDTSGDSQRFSVQILASAHAENALGEPLLRFVGHNNTQFAHPIPIQAWTHVTLTYSGLSLMLYIDGQHVGTVETSLDTAAAQPLLFGRATIDVASEYYQGIIQSATLWSRDLNQEEILDLVYSDVWPSTNPIGHWNFNGASTQLIDLSGNDLHGELFGATWTTTCPTEDIDADGTIAWQDCDDVDPSVTYVGSGNTEWCTGTSCLDILNASPQPLNNGLYWISAGGAVAEEIPCNMTLEDGGWTQIFLAQTSNYNTGFSGLPYQINQPDLFTEASEALYTFVDSQDTTLVVGDYATFPFPSDWRTQSPMQFSAASTTTEVYINGLPIGVETVYYGTCNHQNFCGNNWGTCSSSQLQGRLCISNSTAPYWSRWAGPSPAYEDWCAQSDLASSGTIDTCADSQQLMSLWLR